MANLDSPLRGVSKALLKTFGKALVYRRVVNAAYSDATGKATSSYTDESITGIITSYSRRETNGTTVLEGDKKIVVAAADKGFTAEPDTFGRIVDGAIVYKIVNIISTYAQSLPAIYELQVRK